MVPRKILDNCKCFKIDIPVYGILTVLGEFRRGAQIGHFLPTDNFLGSKQVRIQPVIQSWCPQRAWKPGSKVSGHPWHGEAVQICDVSLNGFLIVTIFINIGLGKFV